MDVENEILVVDEGQTAANTGSVSDPDEDDVTLRTSIGTINNNGDGNWSWSFATNDSLRISLLRSAHTANTSSQMAVASSRLLDGPICQRILLVRNRNIL